VYPGIAMSHGLYRRCLVFCDAFATVEESAVTLPCRSLLSNLVSPGRPHTSNARVLATTLAERPSQMWNGVDDRDDETWDFIAAEHLLSSVFKHHPSIPVGTALFESAFFSVEGSGGVLIEPGRKGHIKSVFYSRMILSHGEDRIISCVVFFQFSKNLALQSHCSCMLLLGSPHSLLDPQDPTVPSPTNVIHSPWPINLSHPTS